MKKSLIALAIASAVSAPAFAATANVDVYGQMMFSVDHVDTNDTTGDSSDVVTGQDNNSRFGIKGAEDLGGGLSAIWQVEMQLNANQSDQTFDFTTTTTGGAVLSTTITTADEGMTLRNTFVGLKSDSLGTVILGRHDTPYKLATGALDLFGDTSADYNNIIGRNSNGSNVMDLRAAGTVAYISPTFAGFNVAAAYIEVKNNEAAGDNNKDGFSVAGMYANGPLFASLAYETHSGDLAGSTGTKDLDAWKAGLGYTFGNAKVGFVYEDMDHDAANNRNSRSAWYLNGAYTMGSIVLKAAYGDADSSDHATSAATEDGATFWVVGADYVLSKRSLVFAQYGSIDNDVAAKYRTNYNAAVTGKEVDTFSLGIKHTF